MQTGARFATLATLALATCFASVRLQPLDTDPAAHTGFEIQYNNATSSSTAADANVTGVSMSEPTPGGTASIPVAIPSQPRCLSVAQWTGNALLATWSDSPSHENVTYYQLSCLVPTERHLLVAATFNASIIDNLDPGKTYVVALRACNAAGCSPNREKDILLSRELDGVIKTPSAGDNQHCSPLPVNQLLEMPMEVRCQPLSPNTVHLSWTDTGASLPIRLDASAYYTVRHAPATKHGPFETLSGPALRPSSTEESLTAAGGSGKRNRNEINATSTSVVYGGLRPAQSYEFAVSKVLLLQQNLMSGAVPISLAHSQSTRFKQSGWSMKIECRTLEAVPGNAPTGLVAKQYDFNAVELSWQPCTQPNGVVVNHTVLVCSEPGCASASADNTLVWIPRAVALNDEFNGGRLVGIVEGLQSDVSYRFRVRDRNSMGESPPSESSNVVYLDPNYTAIDDVDEGAIAQDDYITARNPDSDDRPNLNGDVSSQGYTTPRSGDRRAELPRRFRSRRPTTTHSVSATVPQQEVWYAIVGAVSGAITISVVIVVVIVCRRRRNAKLKRMLRECGTKQADAEGCSRSHRHDHEPDVCGCPRSHQRQVGASTHAHPHSTLSVSLHGAMPSDASTALLYPSAQCMGKTPPTTPRGTLRRFTLSSTLGTPMSAASCVPLLNASNLPGSPFSTGQPDDVRFDSPKFGDIRYDPAGSQPSSPYRLGSTLTSASAAIGGANSCGSPGVVGAAVELRSLSSTADSNGSTGNTDSATREHRAGRGVPFVSPLHLPRTIGLLNALGASTTERTADIPTLPPSQSLFGNAPHAALVGSRMNDLSELRSPERERSRTQAFGAPDLDVCTTAGTGSNSTASLSSGGFAQRGTRSHTHALVDTTILSPLSKPVVHARGTISGGVNVHRAAEEQQRQTSTTRGGGALTPLSVSSSGSGSGSGSANNSGSGCSANAPKTPTIGRSTLPPGCTRNTPPGPASTLRHGGTMMLSPASGTTIDPGYASSTSMSLAPGGGAPSVDSGCISNPSRSTGTAHHRDDFQSYKSFSTDELSAETAHIEGIMKDLSSITQNDFC